EVDHHAAKLEVSPLAARLSAHHCVRSVLKRGHGLLFLLGAHAPMKSHSAESRFFEGVDQLSLARAKLGEDERLVAGLFDMPHQRVDLYRSDRPDSLPQTRKRRLGQGRDRTPISHRPE